MRPLTSEIKALAGGSAAAKIACRAQTDGASPALFLEARGQAKGAVTIDVIYEALQRGGFSFSSTKNDPLGGLKVALGKDGQVKKHPNDTYGLWAWYPGAKRERLRSKKNGDDGGPANSESDVGDDDSGEPSL